MPADFTALARLTFTCVKSTDLSFETLMQFLIYSEFNQIFWKARRRILTTLDIAAAEKGSKSRARTLLETKSQSLSSRVTAWAHFHPCFICQVGTPVDRLQKILYNIVEGITYSSYNAKPVHILSKVRSLRDM